MLILLAVFAPIVASGYAEWKQAEAAASYNEVAEHYLTAAKQLPWQPELYELAGTAYYHAKEYSLANTAYQEAFQRNALSAQGWVAWGDVNYLNGDHPRAAEIWKQGLSQQNPSENLYSRLARIYEEDKDYSAAAEYLQKYMPQHSEDASAHYQLGLLLTLSDPNEALSQLLNASQLDPEFDPAVQTLRTTLNLSSLKNSPSERLVIIGRGLGLVNEWELAHAAFEEAVKDDVKNAEAWAWLGEANQQTGQGGSEELDQALKLNPNLSTVRGLRGLYFQRVGNNREALTEFQAAAQLEPDNPAWVVSIGESYSKLGDLIRALEVISICHNASAGGCTLLFIARGVLRAKQYQYRGRRHLRRGKSHAVDSRRPARVGYAGMVIYNIWQRQRSGSDAIHSFGARSQTGFCPLSFGIIVFAKGRLHFHARSLNSGA